MLYHKYKTQYQKDAVVVEGTYDINTWYSYNNNTRTEVAVDTVTYRDKVLLTLRDKNLVSEKVEVTCRPLQEPNCLEAKISPNGTKVDAEVEREFLVEVIGDTKVKVQVEGEGLEETEINEEEDELDKELNGLDSELLTDEDE